MGKYKTGIIFVIVLGVSIYAVLTLWDRFFEPKSEKSDKDYSSAFQNKDEDESKNDLGIEIENSDTASLNNSSNEDEKEESEDEEEDGTSEMDECEQECANKVEEEENKCLIDCRERIRKEQISKDSCDTLTGDLRYKCIKNKAVEEQDQSLCNQLEDANQKKNCENAVIESIFDQM